MIKNIYFSGNANVVPKIVGKQEHIGQINDTPQQESEDFSYPQYH